MVVKTCRGELNQPDLSLSQERPTILLETWCQDAWHQATKILQCTKKFKSPNHKRFRRIESLCLILSEESLITEKSFYSQSRLGGWQLTLILIKLPFFRFWAMGKRDVPKVQVFWGLQIFDGIQLTDSYHEIKGVYKTAKGNKLYEFTSLAFRYHTLSPDPWKNRPF